MTKSRKIPIRRVLTETPLARQHELRLEKERRRPSIPWSTFCRASYPKAALELAFEAQLALAAGEYGAVDLFARIASAMTLAGAPFDLVAEASRIVNDEIRHADYCYRMAGLLADREAVSMFDTTGFIRISELPLAIEDLDFVLMEISAIGETLAAALLTACQRRATDPVAHALFTAIIGDEVHHARLGWYYFAWRAPQWTHAERQRLADRVGELLVTVEPRFWMGRDAPAGARKGARALGVLDTAGQRGVVRQIMEDEIVPALDALGLGASHAWKVRKKRRVVATFPWRQLRAPLSDDERTQLRHTLERLLKWQVRLGAFPRVVWAPDATPFVSIYARGKLRGCFGSEEGTPEERLCRAFLRALEDIRFGMVSRDEREHLAAQVSYPIDVQECDPEQVSEHLEPGSHGVARVREGSVPVNLLPQVGRDHGYDAPRMLEALAQKAGRSEAGLAGVHVFLFRAEEVAARQSRATSPFGEARAEGYDWLANLVASDGRMDFAIDARSGERAISGLMRHGRIAVALRAFAESRRHAGVVKRCRAWLEREMVRGLRGDTVEGWSDDPSVVAGTLALGYQAGLDVLAALEAHAARPELAANAWHAAQVVCALERRSPPSLFCACVADLEHRPWAPWTTLAARALGDAKALARCEHPLVDALRSSSPHRGGAGVTGVPELALTAVSIEALAGLRSKEARSAVVRGRDFLRRWQLGSNIPASLDPRLSRGAFPASPVASFLRCDVSGHALLALSGESVPV